MDLPPLCGLYDVIYDFFVIFAAMITIGTWQRPLLKKVIILDAGYIQ